MGLLTHAGLILGAYLAAGRVGSVATCLVLGYSAWETLVVSLAIDFVQIPVYGLLIEASLAVAASGRLKAWAAKRFARVRRRISQKGVLARLPHSRPLALVVVSALPLRGFGVLSGCILAFVLDCSRFTGTVSIMAGSLLCSSTFILLFYVPARWMGGL